MNKRKILAYLALILGLIMVQKSLVPIMFGGDHMPDIVLMFVLALAIIDGFDNFLPWALFAGLAYDVASRVAIGLHALIFVIIVYCVSFFSRRFLVDMRSTGAAMLLLFIVLATVVSHLFIAAWIGWNSHDARNFASALGNGWDIGIEAAYNMLMFIILFSAVRKLTKRRTILIRRG